MFAVQMNTFAAGPSSRNFTYPSERRPARQVHHVSSVWSHGMRMEFDWLKPTTEPKKPLQRRRTIVFAPKVQVFKINSLKGDPIAPELWTNKTEFRASKDRCYRIVHRYNRGDWSDDDEEVDTLRGLENKTKYNAGRARQIERNSYRAVLREQRLQDKEGIHDPESIATCYEECANDSKKIALVKAREDELVAMDIYNEDAECLSLFPVLAQ